MIDQSSTPEGRKVDREEAAKVMAKRLARIVRELGSSMSPSGLAACLERNPEVFLSGVDEILSLLNAGQAVPGWRMVPEEPTREMENAAADWIGSDGRWDERSPQRKAEMLYRAMLNAAPPVGRREE